MNTSSYSPIASGTYTYSLESGICFKNKNDQNINTTRLGGAHFYTF